MNLVMGGVVLAYPEVTISVFLVVLAIWAMLIGAIQIVSVFQLRRIVRQRWPFVLNGSLAMLFSIVILLNPFDGAVVLTIFVGAYAILLGIFFVIVAFKIRSIRQDIEKNTTETFTLH